MSTRESDEKEKKKPGRPSQKKNDETRSCADDEAHTLIELWASHRNLYNTKRKNYFNRDLRHYQGPWYHGHRQTNKSARSLRWPKKTDWIYPVKWCWDRRCIRGSFTIAFMSFSTIRSHHVRQTALQQMTRKKSSNYTIYYTILLLRLFRWLISLRTNFKLYLTNANHLLVTPPMMAYRCKYPPNTHKSS